jgi:hypothetical protein
MEARTVRRPLRLKPIFDTNIFGHVQSELIPQSDWRFLLQHRSRRGWPLSLATVLELLAGLDSIPSEKCPNLQAQVKLAFDLSRGRVLEDAFLLCLDGQKVTLNVRPRQSQTWQFRAGQRF